MKKGFSLAELLIALVIAGTIGAITIPVILRTMTDTSKPLYKAAFKNTELIVSDLVSDINLYPLGNFYNPTDATYFCNNFANKVNTIGTVTCNTSTDPVSPNFNTTNGMSWYFLNNTFASSVTIRVDVDGPSKGKDTDGSDILGITITPTGKVLAPTSTESNLLTN